MKKKIILVDCYAIFYKVYYAFINNPLTNSKNEETSVIFGFFNLLHKIIADRQPTFLGCVFDPKTKIFRHEIAVDYKANRPPTPDSLREQIKVCDSLLKAMGLPLLCKDFYEADDLIAAYALQADKTDNIVEIFSADKDLAQLIDDHIYLVNFDRKTNDYLILDRDSFKTKYDLVPEQMIDYLALVGDNADNIAGVKGIGPKTAVSLLKEYQTLTNIYENVGSIKSTVAKKLKENRENAFLSQKLVTLYSDIEGIPPIDELVFQDFDLHLALEILKEKECQKIIDKYQLQSEKATKCQTLLELIGGNGDTVSEKEKLVEEIKTELEKFDRQEITDLADLKMLIKKAEEDKFFVFDLETTSLDPFTARIVAVVFTFADRSSYYLRTLTEVDGQIVDAWEEYASVLKDCFENHNILKSGHNLKFEYSILSQKKITLKGIHSDTIIAEHLLDPNTTQYNLEHLIEKYFSIKKKKYKELMGKETNILKISPTELREYTYEDGEYTLLLYEKQKEKLTAKDQSILFALELPLISVLAEMELQGVCLDIPHFYNLEIELKEKIQKTENTIYKIVGEKFNLNSPKQLQQILFEKLQIQPLKKNKTGYSTDNYVLEKLAKKHLIAEELLLYRKYNKLLNTYLEAIPKLVHPQTQRIHTSYNQSLAATGRLSSSNPNLQNIPIREEGVPVRKGFVAPKGFVLVSLDYSQVELRVLAFMSREPTLLKAYQQNEDIHKKTAVFLFKKSFEEITPQERSLAKVINFSVIYGSSAYSLAEELEISQQEAKEFIEVYFQNYAKIKEYIQQTIDFARSEGYVETYYGRKRPIINIHSENFFMKSHAERTAFNTIIQGTAADIIKHAMINIQKKIRSKQILVEMVMQVHDELVFYIPKNENLTTTIEELKKQMILIPPFDKILKVDATSGEHWQK